MQPGYKQAFFYHRIPEAADIGTQGEIKAKPRPAWLFGILDSSGSMSSHWAFVAQHYNELMDEVDQDKVFTICFDDKVHEEPKKKIENNINKYGSGSTNILLAFQEFENRLAKIPLEDEIKVIFLSDGQDNCNGGKLQEKLKTLKGGAGRKITFMCLGVQSGFPTFISMYLREIYHTGDATCPSIFLVEFSSDKAFFNKFQSIRPFIKTKEEIKVDPEQFLFPWEAVAPTIPEGRWIMSEDSKITLNNGAAILEYDDKLFSIEAVIEVFRSWTQKLQLDSINKKITAEKTKEFAESTYNLMMDIIEDIRKSKGLKLIVTEADESAANDFNTKVLNLQIKRTGTRIQGYLQSMKELKEGLNLQKLSEFEAAKIIGLGTIVGKHQQRALAMKNITKDRYKAMVSEFLSVLDSTPLNDTTDTPAAYLTKMTPIKMLKDKTLKEGLEKIDSPLAFLELFPLQGIPVKVKRNDGCATNPWLVEVKEYSTSTPSVDATQFDLAMHKAMLPENNVETEYQAFVPLLGPNDQQLAPFFNTDLFKYALSYNCTFEIDDILEDAYLSLLAGLFEIAYKKNDEKAKEIVEKIYFSIKAISQTPRVKKLLEGFKAGDAKTLAEIPTLGLFYLLTYYLSRENPSKEENEEYVQKLWIAYFSKKLETKKIPDFVTTEQESNVKEELKKKYTPEYISKTFYTGQAIKNHLKVNLEKEIKENDQIGAHAKVILNKNVYTADTNENLSFEVTKRLSQDAAGINLADNDVLNYLAHCVKFQTNQERYANLLASDSEEAYKTLAKEFLTKDDSSKKLVKRISYQLLDEMSQVYYKQFKKLHWNVLPMKKEEVETACKQKNIDFNTLGYCEQTGLCKNACMSKECPWFLFVRKKERSLRSHLGGWQSFLPRGFHAYVKANPTSTAEAIFDQFIVKGGNTKNMEAAGVTQEQCIKYIADVKSHYAQ
jgi:hypothetical protein